MRMRLRNAAMIVCVLAMMAWAASGGGCVAKDNPIAARDSTTVAAATTQQAASAQAVKDLTAQITAATAAQREELQTRLTAARTQAAADNTALSEALARQADDLKAIKTQQAKDVITVASGAVGAVNPLWGTVLGIIGAAAVGGLGAWISHRSGASTQDRLADSLVAAVSAGTVSAQAHGAAVTALANNHASVVKELGAALAASAPAPPGGGVEPRLA